MAAANSVRVRLEVRVPAAPVGDVRVELRRGEIGVPEHLLHRPQVRSPLEQVRRERVAEEMGMHTLGLEARLLGEPAEDEERPGAGQGTALGVQEELGPATAVEERPAAGEVAADARRPPRVRAGRSVPCRPCRAV